MGIDVNLYAIGDVTDPRLAEANAFMRSRDIVGDYSDIGDSDPLVRSKYADDGRVEWQTWHRYYGPGYERGPWAAIHNAIVCMRAALPECTIHYGGDVEPDAPEVTDEMLAGTWAHYLGPNGDAYHKERQSWNARSLT